MEEGVDLFFVTLYVKHAQNMGYIQVSMLPNVICLCFIASCSHYIVKLFRYGIHLNTFFMAYASGLKIAACFVWQKENFVAYNDTISKLEGFRFQELVLPYPSLVLQFVGSLHQRIRTIFFKYFLKPHRLIIYFLCLMNDIFLTTLYKFVKFFCTILCSFYTYGPN